MPPTNARGLLLLLAACGLWSCSLRDDGLRRQLEMERQPSTGRPAVILPGEGAENGPTTPPGSIDMPAGAADAAPVASDAGVPGQDAGVAVDASTSPDGGPGGPALAALGQSCARAADCGSGFCVDGVCCSGACTGICEFCAAEGSTGRCTPVAGAPRGGRTACMGTRAPCAGTCDGQDGSRCQYAGAETVCMPATCTDSIARTGSTCNGTGQCHKRLQVDCTAGCSGTLCANGCSPQRPCPNSQYCAGGRCFTKQAGGVACAHPEQCQSAACVDGFCCQRQACGSCQACTGAGGTCVPINTGIDPDTCTDGRTCSAGGTCQ
jgi:hypothetical protein